MRVLVRVEEAGGAQVLVALLVLGIHREAGVGIATLFRHFPAKEDLVAAVFADRLDAYAEAAGKALAEPDPWQGLTGFMEAVCAMQAADSGVAAMLTMTFPATRGLEERRRAAYRAAVALIDRAKEAGRLRDDFTPEDLMLLHMANAGVIAATGTDAPGAWRRVVALLIQAYEAPARGQLPDAPAPRALYRAMLRASQASYARPEPGAGQ